MRAVFGFKGHGADEIVVQNQGSAVLLQFFQDYDGQCDTCKAAGEGAMCSSCHVRKNAGAYAFKKAEARSLASAIMGAAAEL